MKKERGGILTFTQGYAVQIEHILRGVVDSECWKDIEIYSLTITFYS